MNTDIYRTKNLPDAYLFVPSEADIKTLSIPVSLNLHEWEFFKSITLTPDCQLIVADPNEVISNIQKNGYHLEYTTASRSAQTGAEMSEVGAALGAGILAASLGAGPIGAIISASVGYAIAHSARKGQ